jgi:hypothetical protein
MRFVTMNKLFLSSALLLSIAATGCTIETGTTIDPTTLSGVVDGQTWTFAAGHTDAYLSEGEDEFFATLYPTAFTPCGFSEPNAPHLIVSIPKVPGDYDMGFDRNMTFVSGSRNMVAFDGRIKVDSVSATRITGGLAADYDFDNEVSGMFDITICDR